jgi:hypothetical protein|tara:strand:+ start:218 stop:988 length:771 start_codon:yes stop_codon:yes gene_type:complete
MSEINEVNIPNVAIPNIVSSESWIYGIPNIPSNHPPVTTNIGFPIVEIPGCVKMHKDNQDKVTRMPFDYDLVNQDEDGVTTLCPHGEYPTYDAMDYTPEQLIIQRETPPPPVSPPPEIDPPEIPDTGDIGGKEELACPGPNQLRVGDVTQSGDERVIGHQLIDNGKTCETLYEPTSVVEKFLPSANQATTTVSIAVLATAGAAATPLLLRVIKPIVKKVITFVKKKLGKNVDKPSMSEIKTNKYREKKGLPPIKRK